MMIEHMFMWCVIILTIVGSAAFASATVMSLILWIKTEFLPEWRAYDKKDSRSMEQEG